MCVCVYMSACCICVCECVCVSELSLSPSLSLSLPLLSLALSPPLSFPPLSHPHSPSLPLSPSLSLPPSPSLPLSLSGEGFNMEAGQLFCGGCYGESYGASVEGVDQRLEDTSCGWRLWISSGTLTASLAL